MKLTIITLFPDMISGFFKESIIKRAVEKGLVEIEIVNLREFALDSYGTVDGRPYGGGAGMVLRADVIQKALDQKKGAHIVLTSPKGMVFTQKKAEELSKKDHVVILAGHYEEFDERVRSMVSEEISIGDFVLTGGEIVAAAIADSMVRLLPGVLKKEDATTEESFFEVSLDELINAVGNDELLDAVQKKGTKTVQLLEYPHYTRPEELNGQRVPEVLLSGDPKKIRKWKLQQAFALTKQNRSDLLQKKSV